MIQRPSFVKSFGRSQVSGAVATAVDYGLLFGTVEFFHLWYVTATALGAAAGAITNFLINRYWSFEASHAPWHGQALRYTLVSAGSLLLNTGGVWLVTEKLHLHYAISVGVVSFIVALAFNYPLHRHYVFK